MVEPEIVFAVVPDSNCHCPFDIRDEPSENVGRSVEIGGADWVVDWAADKTGPRHNVVASNCGLVIMVG